MPESVVSLEINGIPFTAEVADTPDRIAKGLSGRDWLPENHGMLFRFSRPIYPTFWMKDTKLALSVAFVDDGEIVEIQDMQPFSLAPHVPSRLVACAIEMPLGWFRSRGIRRGDAVMEIT